MEQEKAGHRKGYTFIVKVLGTEHGTWQGRVEHVQSGSEDSFRSGLDLIRKLLKYMEEQDSGNKKKTYSHIS